MSWTRKTTLNYHKKCADTHYLKEVNGTVYCITANPWGVELKIGKGTIEHFGVETILDISFRKNVKKVNEMIKSLTSSEDPRATAESLGLTVRRMSTIISGYSQAFI